MINTVCTDGRCRGLFQFYGASRTGRWAGRLIQLQNLPQKHLPDLEQARDLVRQGDYEMLNILYESVPGVLSELIRTAFIPEDGKKFIVSAFCDPRRPRLRSKNGHRAVTERPACGVKRPPNSAVRLQP